MTTTSLGDLFDSYVLRARVFPALITILPITIALLVFGDLTGAQKISSLFISAGGMYLIVNLVHGRGLNVEETLVRGWSGWPTTHALKSSGTANETLRLRRRQQLERLTGMTLPSPGEEIANPTASDSRYEAAVRMLIVRVREQQARFPRVQEELTYYGFRRNLFALKPFAVLLACAAMVVAGLRALGHGWGHELVATVGVDALLLMIWLLLVNPNWVRQAGERYAERLLETLESL